MAVITPPSLTPAPTPPPQRNDRTTFSSRVDAFVTWLITAVTEFGAIANNVALNATDAATSASTASTQAGDASTSASTASTQASNASASASTASTQASNSSTSATNAASSATASAASAVTAANAAAGLVSTSTTSVTIGTGSKVFTTQASKQYTAGAWVVITGVSPSDYMLGQVTTYSGTTLTVDVTYTSGSGTFSSWNISLSGPQGIQGIQGIQGTAGFNGTPDFLLIQQGVI